jgi:flagellar basal body-associated protein FliL
LYLKELTTRQTNRNITGKLLIIIITIIIVIIIIIIIVISCRRFSSFPGTSPLEPVVNPTTQASSLSL